MGRFRANLTGRCKCPKEKPGRTGHFVPFHWSTSKGESHGVVPLWVSVGWSKPRGSLIPYLCWEEKGRDGPIKWQAKKDWSIFKNRFPPLHKRTLLFLGAGVPKYPFASRSSITSWATGRFETYQSKPTRRTETIHFYPIWPRLKSMYPKWPLRFLETKTNICVTPALKI